ncbi:NAD(P)-dependent oxidoreductase [Yinghuangia sp. YIM S10712]|uniref:NAD(P)-dependent oxidoreductase n=1 Tax=Yinghuangia sp. YIM S10712 TaxID=3436930 RepID=UPI003F53C2D7
MRIAVFGAAGNVGSRVVAEAWARGHEVTAVVRGHRNLSGLPADVDVRTGDARDPDDVAAATVGQDLVITATRPAPGREAELPEATRALLAGIGKTGVRVLAVGGAGSLTVPGTGGRTVAGMPDFPADWAPIAAACAEQLDVYRAAPAEIDWAYLSPAAILEPGERTGVYRLGGDTLLVDADGNSSISTEDLAVALLDEAERPRHHRTRFTVGY